MSAIKRFRHALDVCQVDKALQAQIMAGNERINDQAPKPRRAAFFAAAVERMDELLDAETCHAVRDACACSKSGWRLAAMQKVARETEGMSLEQKLQAIGKVHYMGDPVLNADGTITGGVGSEGGFECPCPVFSGSGWQQPVSITYCYCCAGHFRFHYQVALGVKLATQEVLSSALESNRTKPCRFVYQIVDCWNNSVNPLAEQILLNSPKIHP